MRPIRSRPGAALQVVAGAIALAALVGAGLAGYRSASRTVPNVSTLELDPEPLTNQELAMALARAGLDAQPLAAAGLTGPQVTGLVGRARAHLQAHIQTLRDADSAYISAKASADQLQRLIQSGRATPQDLAAYAPAQSALASAAAVRQEAIDDLFAAAVNAGAPGGLSPEQSTALSTIHANAAWALPTQYLAASHAPADWVALRDALANDRISAARSEEPDPAAHQILLAAQADPSTAAANTNLQNLAEVQAAWSSAIGP